MNIGVWRVFFMEYEIDEVLKTTCRVLAFKNRAQSDPARKGIPDPKAFFGKQ